MHSLATDTTPARGPEAPRPRRARAPRSGRALVLAAWAAAATPLGGGVARAEDDPSRARPPANGRARDPLGALRDAVERARAEARIEGRIVAGYLRGVLGERPPAPDWTPRSHGKGRLERGPGGLPLLHLEGTPEELGEQQGTLLRAELQALARTYVRAFVGPRELAAARARAVRLFDPHLTDDERRELAALARAAGLERDDVLLAQSFTDLYRLFGCTTLAGPAADGGALLARNLDFPDLGFLGRYSIVSVVRPAGKRAWVSVTWPGIMGALSGQSRDLALSVLVVHGAESVRAGVPFQLAFRRVLEQAGSVDEAEALLRRTPITVTNNLTLADRAGAVRVLELHPEGIAARGPGPEGWVASANHFVAPERREPRASVVYLSSRQRYRAICEVAERSGPLDAAEARAALDAAASRVATLQSMVFRPAEGALEVAFSPRAPATRARWVRLEGLLEGE